MNKIVVDDFLYHQTTDIDNVVLRIKYIIGNPRMYLDNEFAFDDGAVYVNDKSYFVFKKVLYDGDEENQIGKVGFLVEFLDNNRKHVQCFLSVSLAVIDGKEYTDIYFEPANEYAYEKFKDKAESQIDDCAYKLLSMLDVVQRKALKSKKRIIKMKSEMNRTFKETSSTWSRKNTIVLDGHITYQFVKEYNDVRPYERHTDAWMVRGHIRHYKSGKEVFIPSYKKGHGAINDKEYAVAI